jgi:hypothetical protein
MAVAACLGNQRRGAKDMQRYFFNIFDGRSHADQTGEDMHDDQAAWHRAIELTRDIENLLVPGDKWRLDVLDGGESPVFLIEVATQKFR